jgi:hypothetical protein
LDGNIDTELPTTKEQFTEEILFSGIALNNYAIATERQTVVI